MKRTSFVDWDLTVGNRQSKIIRDFLIHVSRDWLTTRDHVTRAKSYSQEVGFHVIYLRLYCLELYLMPETNALIENNVPFPTNWIIFAGKISNYRDSKWKSKCRWLKLNVCALAES